MRILFLYTELADYTLACLNKLAEKEVSVLVVHYPVNQEAPFDFQFGQHAFIGIDQFRGYREFRKKMLAFGPDRIVCSGWGNSWYRSISRELSRTATCILAMDNHWTGSLKQKLFRFLYGMLLRPVFSKIWIPGLPQLEYARKLGYSEKDIWTGFYCCDKKRFDGLGENTRLEKAGRFPRNLICVARYIPQKNYKFLWDGFLEWKKRSPSGVKLYCAGSGEQYEQRTIHPDIIHLGFVQKQQWDHLIRETGVFVLPSLEEPWGVAVQEFVSAGYPLLLSDRVGAATVFLDERNGVTFDPENTESLIGALQEIFQKEDWQLIDMADHSRKLSDAITPEQWCGVLLSP